QSLAILFYPLHDAVLVGDHVLDALSRHCNAVDIEHAVNHLDAVARQTDDAFDVIDRIILRQPEDHDIATLRLRTEDASREKGRRKGEGIMCVAVREFGHEQIIAHQKGRNHRTGGNVEWLKQKSADDQGDDQSVKHHAYCLGKATFFPFGSGLHAHWPIILDGSARGGLVTSETAASNYTRDLVAASKKPILRNVPMCLSSSARPA